MNRAKQSLGFTLIEVIVSVAISSVILTGITLEFANVFKYSRDFEIKADVREVLRSLFEIVASDIRNIGSGMPNGQSNFKQSTLGVGDASLAILSTSDSTSLNIRLSENGKSTLSSASFDNTSMVKELNLLSTADFEAGDIIYLSEMTSGGTAGMRALVSSVSSPTKIIVDSVVLPTGITTLRSSSMVSKVSEVSIQQNDLQQAIVRTVDGSSIVLAPKSTISFSYLDISGTSIAPLTSANIASSLAIIRTTITVKSSRLLSNSTYYSESKTLDIVPRNLITSR